MNQLVKANYCEKPMTIEDGVIKTARNPTSNGVGHKMQHESNRRKLPSHPKKGSWVNQNMKEQGQPILWFIYSHPIVLEKKICDEVIDDKIKADCHTTCLQVPSSSLIQPRALLMASLADANPTKSSTR